MKKLIYILFYIWLPLLAGGSQVLFSQQNTVKLELRNANDMDICGAPYQKEVLVEIRLGNVLYADSLYGFEILMKYDNTKLLYDNVLFSQATLFNNDDIKMGKVFNDSVEVFALVPDVSSPPKAGNKPLAVVKFIYFDECPDTSNIEVIYFEAVDGYKKEIDYNTGLKIYAVEKDKEERHINLEFTTDTLQSFDNDSIGIVEIIPDFNKQFVAKIYSFETDIFIEDNQQFEFTEISCNPEFNINEISDIENGKKVKITINDFKNTEEQNLLSIKVKEKYKADKVCKIYTANSMVNDCACITNIGESFAFIKSKKSIDSVIENVNEIDSKVFEIRYISPDESLLLNLTSAIIKKINIYDINGRNISRQEYYNDSKEVIIDTSFLLNGLYQAAIEFNDYNVKKILLIKL